MFGIGKAVKEMQDGQKVRRLGWADDKDAYMDIKGPDGHSKVPYVSVHATAGDYVLQRLSSEDILAIDWIIFEYVAGGARS